MFVVCSDLQSECGKFGEVKKIMIFDVSPPPIRPDPTQHTRPNTHDTHNTHK